MLVNSGKKVKFALLLLIIILPLAIAQNTKTAGNIFSDLIDRSAEYTIVLADGADSTKDNLAAINMAGKYGITNIEIASQDLAISESNLIILGSPSVNSVTAIIAQDSSYNNLLSDIEVGKAKIITSDLQSKNQLVIAGNSGTETRIAAKAAIKYAETEPTKLNENSIDICINTESGAGQICEQPVTEQPVTEQPATDTAPSSNT